MSDHDTWHRRTRFLWRLVLVTLVSGVLAAVAPSAQAQNDEPLPAVIDPSGVLGRAERQFLANAVRDVRSRTDYRATVVVADDLAGRSPNEIADQIITIPPPEGDLSVTLVMAPGPPPTAAVTAPGDEVGETEEKNLRYAGGQAQRAADAEGLPQAGLAFTAALIDGAPGTTTSRPTGFILVAGLILAVSAFRTFREWQRVHPLPSEPTPIASLGDGPALVHGHIGADRSLSLSTTGDLVWFEAEESNTIKRYTRWGNQWTGDTWLKEEGSDTKFDHRSEGVPFWVVDGTESVATVVPDGAMIDAPKLEKAGGTFSDHSWKLRGLRLNDSVTIGGHVERVSAEEVVFRPKRRTGSDVMVTTRSATKASSWFKRRLYKRYAWTTLWTVIFLLSLTATTYS